MNPNITFCISTYNRSKQVFDLVQSLLSAEYQSIEVVVVDDCSTDNTKELLESIHDNRFKYILNETNLGASHTWYKALKYGNGKFLYCLNDYDLINCNLIEQLINLLNNSANNNVGFYFIDRQSKEIGIETYVKELDALCKLAYVPYHPSEIVFLKEAFDYCTSAESYFTAKDFYKKLYPHGYVMSDLALQFGGAVIKGDFWIANDGNIGISNAYKKQKNSMAKYWQPEATIQIICFIASHINQLDITTDEKKHVFYDKYKKMMARATEYYRNVAKRPDVTRRYGIKEKQVKFIEFGGIERKFYKETIKYLHKNVSFCDHSLDTKLFNYHPKTDYLAGKYLLFKIILKIHRTIHK